MALESWQDRDITSLLLGNWNLNGCSASTCEDCQYRRCHEEARVTEAWEVVDMGVLL